MCGLTENARFCARDPDGEAPGASVLSELKAVGEGYPFYGQLTTDPPRALAPKRS